jgi:hypothetical protein
MIQGGENFGLTLESSYPLGISGHGCWQDLDRDLAFQVRVGRAIHLAHPTRAERRDDLIRAEARAWSHPHL